MLTQYSPRQLRYSDKHFNFETLQMLFELKIEFLCLVITPLIWLTFNKEDTGQNTAAAAAVTTEKNVDI